MRSVLVFSLCAYCAASAGLFAGTEFRGAAAMEHTRQMVAYGPRPSASSAIIRTQQYILRQLRALPCEIETDAFTARTPLGSLPMKNILMKCEGPSRRIVAITGHYDTKRMIQFVGANDGGSSAGFLLEMARVVATSPRTDSVYLVWLDGEEAVKTWTKSDSLYGSRHLVEKFRRDGRLSRLKAVINVDMIGDKDLKIMNEENSTLWLRRMIWSAARDKGYGAYFDSEPGYIEDDHLPFLEAGVPAVDLIDFNFGPANSYWHSSQDSIDKLNEKSFQMTGDVLVETLRRLAAK